MEQNNQNKESEQQSTTITLRKQFQNYKKKTENPINPNPNLNPQLNKQQYHEIIK